MHDLAKIYKLYISGSNYQYEVIKLDSKGDTLSKDIIEIIIPVDINENISKNNVFYIWN